MGFYTDVLKAEKQRTMNYGADICEEETIQCPVCGGDDWNFLIKDAHGDYVGCQDCISKVYLDEIEDKENFLDNQL